MISAYIAATTVMCIVVAIIGFRIWLKEREDGGDNGILLLGISLLMLIVQLSTLTNLGI